jgi:heme/copper-type cytochrome/quinol oxidase subunit 2
MIEFYAGVIFISVLFIVLVLFGMMVIVTWLKRDKTYDVIRERWPQLDEETKRKIKEIVEAHRQK